MQENLQVYKSFNSFVCFSCFFRVRLLKILRGHSVFSSKPQRPMTSDFKGFLYQILSITLLFLILIIFQTLFILQRLQNQNIEFILHVHFFCIRILSVLRCHSGFPSPPQRPMTSDFQGFSIPDFIHYIYFPIFILEKEPLLVPFL